MFFIFFFCFFFYDLKKKKTEGWKRENGNRILHHLRNQSTLRLLFQNTVPPWWYAAFNLPYVSASFTTSYKFLKLSKKLFFFVIVDNH